MKKVTVILCLILALCLSLNSLAAVTVNIEGLPIVEETISFDVMVLEPREGAPYVAFEDKPIIIELEADTNVKINFEMVSGANWGERVNIVFASGDLPDAIIGYIDVTANHYQLQPLDELISQYAPNVKTFLESHPNHNKAMRLSDGKIYSLPIGDEAFTNMMTNVMWINTKWLENVGMEMPTTTEDFYNVLKAFKEKDANGNGNPDDEIPFSFAGIGYYGNSAGPFFGAWGLTHDRDRYLMVKDDKVIFPYAEDKFREALVYLNKLYQEGLLDAEAFTQSNDQYISKGATSDIFGVCYAWSPNYVAKSDPELWRVYKPLLLEGPYGDKLINMDYQVRNGGFSITTACQNPEVLVRWYDYINSSLKLALEVGRGQEDVYWKWVDKEAQTFMFTYENVPEGTTHADYRAMQTFAGQTPALWRLEYGNLEQANPNSYTSTMLKIDAVKELQPYGVYTQLPPGYGSEENADQRAFLLADISTYVNKFVADAVMNGIDDAKWQEHQKQLKALRVEEYISLCQEYMDNIRSR